MRPVSLECFRFSLAKSWNTRSYLPMLQNCLFLGSSSLFQCFHKGSSYFFFFFFFLRLTLRKVVCQILTHRSHHEESAQRPVSTTIPADHLFYVDWCHTSAAETGKMSRIITTVRICFIFIQNYLFFIVILNQ